jgi:hypothetical protein
MNRRKNQYLTLALLGILLALLPACSLPVSVPVTGGNTQTPTEDASPTAVTETIAPTWTPLASATSTSTSPPPTPTHTTVQTTVPSPTFTATHPPQVSDPSIVTLRVAEVREGPGLSYAFSHALGAGTSAPVLGRSTDGLWWVIPGPGDGPGPVGWIQAADVEFFGNADQVPVLQSPTNPADVPVHSDPGSPPSNACVVEPFGSDLGPVLVHLGPGEHFNISHRLGGWAEVVNTEMGWYQILLGPGEVGWVDGSRVQASGPCPN